MPMHTVFEYLRDEYLISPHFFHNEINVFLQWMLATIIEPYRKCVGWTEEKKH